MWVLSLFARDWRSEWIFYSLTCCRWLRLRGPWLLVERHHLFVEHVILHWERRKLGPRSHLYTACFRCLSTYFDFERVDSEHPVTLFLRVLVALERCEGENDAQQCSFLYHRLFRFTFATQIVWFQAPKTKVSLLDSTKPTLDGQVLFIYAMFPLADCTQGRRNHLRVTSSMLRGRLPSSSSEICRIFLQFLFLIGKASFIQF